MKITALLGALLFGLAAALFFFFTVNFTDAGMKVLGGVSAASAVLVLLGTGCINHAHKKKHGLLGQASV